MPVDIKVAAATAQIEKLRCDGIIDPEAGRINLAVARDIERIVMRSVEYGHEPAREAIRAAKSVWMLHASASLCGEAIEPSMIDS